MTIYTSIPRLGYLGSGIEAWDMKTRLLQDPQFQIRSPIEVRKRRMLRAIRKERSIRRFAISRFGQRRWANR